MSRFWMASLSSTLCLLSAACSAHVEAEGTNGSQDWASSGTGAAAGSSSSPSGTGASGGADTGVGGSGGAGAGGASALSGASYTTSPGYFDVVWDTERNQVFLSRGADGEVQVLDLATGQWSTIATGYRAEHMFFDPVLDQVVISLAAEEHSPYWWDDEQYGYIGVIDAVGLGVEIFPVAFDPWQIVADGEGHAFVSGGSGQWTSVMSLDFASGATAFTNYSVYDSTNIQMHPAKDRVYGADTGLSPSDIERYDVANGTIEYSYDSPYHGDYPMCGDLRIHPSGNVIYTRCGHVFLATNQAGSDMTWTGDIGFAWRDLAMHPDGKAAYAIPDKSWDEEQYEPVLHEIDTDSLQTVATYTLTAPAERVLASKEGLVFVRLTLGGNPETEIEVIPYDAL
jgi:hypothetical protein